MAVFKRMQPQSKDSSNASSGPGAQVTSADLATIGVFGGLSDEALQLLLVTMEKLFAPAGSVVFAEGEAGREMYVVLEGEVELLAKGPGAHERRLAILGPNDCFGEMSLIDMQPRSANARALAPSHLLRLTSEMLDLLYRKDLRSYAIFTLNVARVLSRRLRIADAMLINASRDTPSGKEVARPLAIK